MYDELHWWQFPLDLISIELQPDFKKEFFAKARNHFPTYQAIAELLQEKAGKYGKVIKSDYRLVWCYERGKSYRYFPGWMVYEIALEVGVDLLEIEKNIVSYVSSRGKVRITNPKFPVLVTPEFSSIPIHIMCDGSRHIRKFAYTQNKKEDMKRFIRVIKNIFGDYETKEFKRTMYVPTIFSEVLSNYYGINDYRGSNFRIPEKIRNGSKGHKLATILATLQDEGNSTERILFGMCNKRFIADLMNLSKSLEYKCGTLMVSEPNPNAKGHWSQGRLFGVREKTFYSFVISIKSIDNFLNDVDELTLEFPDMDIGEKLENIRNMSKVRKRSWRQRSKGETLTVLLLLLKYKGDKTAFELMKDLNISLWTIYHHLQKLMRWGAVSKYKIGSRHLYHFVS